MDLIAGDAREIVLALALDDEDSFSDRTRFDAYLPLGAGLDPTWLDLFSEAVRTTTGQAEPEDFLDARREFAGPELADRTIERIDPTWVTAVARLADHELDAVTGRWIDLLEEDLGDLAGEEKPWIRVLAGEVVTFCRTADRSRDVIFAWAL
jgi:hypothetical protein